MNKIFEIWNAAMESWFKLVCIIKRKAISFPQGIKAIFFTLKNPRDLEIEIVIYADWNPTSLG